jgi:soluble lytic murein transglycosylase
MAGTTSTSRFYGVIFRAAARMLPLVLIASPLAQSSTSEPDGKKTIASSAAQSRTKKDSPAKTKEAPVRIKDAPAKTKDPQAGAKDAPTKAKAVPAKGKKTSRRKASPKSSLASRMAQTARIKRAFVASAELRPMAQQLATLRTPEAYAGVTAYARKHTGDVAAAAYLALGHAYLLDKRYAEARSAFAEVKRANDELGDYAGFLGAQACHGAGDDAAAEELLRGFNDRYPESIFAAQAIELEANVLLALNDIEGARKVLAEAADTDTADRTGYQFTKGQVELALGQQQAAIATFKQLLLSHPTSSDAQAARSRLAQLGAEFTLTITERRSLADAYYKGGRYGDASEQYRILMRDPGLDPAVRNGLLVADAACQFKLKRLSVAEARALPDTDDENGARRLEMLMELARNRDDSAEQKQIVADMQARFPRSPWLSDALFSSGNMYLLKRDYPAAIEYYSDLATRFPAGKNSAAAHWRAGWLSYRLGLYLDAARIFDEQVRLYPSATETVSALYWRARLYETLDHNPARAVANYRTILRVYQHFYYAQMAKQRLAVLSASEPGLKSQSSEPQLDRLQPTPAPRLVDTFPEDSPHLAKARLVANAGLNEYIAQEIKADPSSSSWSALAEAQIYSSCGETFRALRAVKRALPGAASASIQSIPLAYWRLLYPEPWWDTIQDESAKNHLDPYFVASLIRQESEFNASAISPANAYGLMQLLPSVGRSLAREEGIAHFQTYQLLDPATNIRLGTRYLRQMLDRFGGVQEYALAAYNAGESRVTDWRSAGTYSGLDEFVESIPFTETREYVQAILRNMETYKGVDHFARERAEKAATADR